MNRSAIAVALTLLYASSLVAQTPAPQQASANQPTTPVIRTTTEEVALDMVFHDKKGKTIHDIRPEEVHVYEDGVEQHLNSFKYVEGQAASMSSAEGAPSGGSIPLDPMREVRLVSLVFENLDQDGKRFFRQALQDMLNVAPEQNLYFSVMVIDQKLNMIQSFTNDRAALMKSVDKSMMWDTPQYMRSSSEIKSQLRQTLAPGEGSAQSANSGDLSAPPNVGGNGSAAPSASAIQNSVNWRMAKMQYDMLEQADAADREAGARSTIDSLLALVRAQSKLPGRKVVLYFNPNLFIPEVLKEQYNYMISAANRANITFYTVDPKGLVTWDQSGSGRDQLGSAVGDIQAQQRIGAGAVTQSQARVDETAENGIRSNPLLWLRDLAQQTGGVAIGETNDVKAPLRTVMDDVRTFYEATYDPHNTVLDGKFRRISVKIDRPGIEVHTRSGYFALPRVGGGQQLYAYEVPLMNALSAATPASDIAFRAAAERFSERGPKIEYMLTLEIPMKGLTFAPQPDGKTAMVDAPLLAVVKASSGEVVSKFSKDFAVTVPAANVEGYKEGNLTQTYRTELAPGNYTLESVVMDRKGNKIGVSKSAFTVPEPNPKLAVSDVVLVHKTEQLKDSQLVDPFYYPAGQGYPAGKVVPDLGGSLKGGQGHILPFYFNVYVDPAVKDAPQASMAFYKEGQYLGSAPIALPAPSPDGRIAYVADLPGAAFKPGSYEIKLGVKQGSDTVEQKVDFQVE